MKIYMYLKWVGYKNVIFFLMIFFCYACNSSDNSQFSTWESYQGDDGRTGYSSLDQINKENVDQLEVAWTFETGEPGTMQVNPIVIDHVMYVISSKMKVYALDAVTGDEIWMFDPFEGENRRGLSRGVAYWEDEDDKRILFSAGSFIYALNANNGKIIKEFGKEGKVSLNEGLGRDASKLSVRSTSPGTVYQDLLIQGSSVGETYNAPPGHVRAYDIRTGELKWTFHTIPQPGEPGYETWEPDSWLNIGGANVWAGTSLDKERGLVYLPVAAPKLDFYGGGRKGENL
ncbi:MAG: PQQ-binding-like beta-propeller repeat protein, partial [Cyclobacteriaceae bacterium]